jgi:hypothetical protein
MARTTATRSAAVLLTASLVALGATACNTGGSSVSTDAKPTPAATAASAAQSAGGKSAAKAAKPGDTISLKGMDKAETADVTLVSVVDSPEGADEYTKPADGKRYVAVQFKIKVTGTKAYSDAPDNCVKLLDGQGQSYPSTVADTKAGASFANGSVNIAPGDTALGFVTFEIPKDTKIDKAQFTLDSGVADQTGQWNLGQ